MTTIHKNKTHPPQNHKDIKFAQDIAATPMHSTSNPSSSLVFLRI
jgi:hypothetical protein